MKITQGQVLLINEESFEVLGKASLHWHEGDNEESLTLHGLRRQRDGQPFYLANERNEPALYATDVPLSQPDWNVTHPARSMTLWDEAFGDLPAGDVKVTRIEARAGVATGLAESPLRGVYEGYLIVSQGAPADASHLALLGRRLIWQQPAKTRQDGRDGRDGQGGQGGRDGQQSALVTDDTPAGRLPARAIPRVSTTTSFSRRLCDLLVLGLAALVALDPRARTHATLDFVPLIWSLGLGSIVVLIVVRHFFLRPFFHIVAAAFLLQLQTGLLEHLLGAAHALPTWNLEGYRLAGTLALLVLLDVAAPRYYAMVAHASLLGGILLLALYSVGFAIWALGSGQWHTYRQHVGALPQGALSVLLFVGLLIHRIHDYRRVPVTLDGTLALLDQLERELRGGLTEVHARARAVAELADDLGDAFVVSNDPRVACAHVLSMRFYQLSALLKKVGSLGLDRVREPALAHEDLATLREDLAALHRALRRSEPSEPLPEPRLPPGLQTAIREPQG